LKVYIGVPDNVNVKEAISIKEAMRKNENVPFITLGELYVRLGGKL